MLSRRAPLLVLLMTTVACTPTVGGPPGLAVVATRDDAIIRLDVEGSDSSGAAITPDTPMRVASITKSFTAAGVLTLVDEGRVDLERPLVTYVPERCGHLSWGHEASARAPRLLDGLLRRLDEPERIVGRDIVSSRPDAPGSAPLVTGTDVRRSGSHTSRRPMARQMRHRRRSATPAVTSPAAR